MHRHGCAHKLSIDRKEGASLSSIELPMIEVRNAVTLKYVSGPLACENAGPGGSCACDLSIEYERSVKYNRVSIVPVDLATRHGKSRL
jgi:hypothetical protein